MAKYEKNVTMKYIDTIGNEITTYPKTKMEQVIGLEDTLGAVRVTLGADNWSSSAPYTQTVHFEGMKETWKPGPYVLVSSGDIDADLDSQLSAGYITWIDTGNDIVTFTCGREKPFADFTLEITGILEVE